MGQQLPASSGDDAHTTMLVELPPDLARIAAVADTRQVEPPYDAVCHSRKLFDYPQFRHPRLEMIEVIVDENRPMRLQSTIFGRLYGLFGTAPTNTVDSLDDALQHIDAKRPYPRPRRPGTG